MRLGRERAFMGLLLLAAPVLVGLVLLPSTRRLARLRQRLAAAHEDTPQVRPFAPVSARERAFLDDPQAPWRSRLPLVADDGARLVLVDRVVNEVGAALAARGVKVEGMKALLDPVEGAFRLPRQRTREAFPRQAATDAPEREVDGWVLEVEILGPTGELFKALAAIVQVNALLEPAGLRWEAGPARNPGAPGGSPERRQVLQLRNLYLKPGS